MTSGWSASARSVASRRPGDSVAYLQRQSLRQRAEVGDLVNVILIDTLRPDAVRDRVQDAATRWPSTTSSETIRLAEDAQSARVVTPLDHDRHDPGDRGAVRQ